MNIKFENLGTVNKNKVTLGDLVVWFSYETPVAYQLGYSPIVVRQNDWSVTTGKLLNDLQSDKKQRVDGKTFEHNISYALQNAYKRLAMADVMEILK